MGIRGEFGERNREKVDYISFLLAFSWNIILFSPKLTLLQLPFLSPNNSRSQMWLLRLCIYPGRLHLLGMFNHIVSFSGQSKAQTMKPNRLMWMHQQQRLALIISGELCLRKPELYTSLELDVNTEIDLVRCRFVVLSWRTMTWVHLLWPYRPSTVYQLAVHAVYKEGESKPLEGTATTTTNTISKTCFSQSIFFSKRYRLYSPFLF